LLFHVERRFTWNMRDALAKVIAVVNQKGGVGKTTTAVNLSAGLALAERRTVLIDLDPQGNATTGLGLNKAEPRRTVYNVLLDGLPLNEATTPTELPYLSIVPSEMDLVGAEIELVSTTERENRLKNALDAYRDQLDFMIVDCPPSLGLLTLNALTAADSVLIPLQCEYYAMEGLAQLIRTINMVRERLNPKLAIEGILFTMFDGRTSLAAQVKTEVHQHLGGQTFSTVIPRNIRLTEAPSHGRPVFLYDLRSSGSIAYLDLTREVLSHG
jgi:chromosome partitioning protein